tara:strand:- start:404 stop:856 length:453 start_codon:yes stop_codon:yes gene_type:complete
MRLLIQKVNEAKVLVSSKVVGKINKGLLIFQGVDEVDTQDDISWLVNKVINLRIFNDSNNIMNLSVKDIEGDILVVSQFTLMASVKKGNRPSYKKAANKNHAISMYKKFIDDLNTSHIRSIRSGIFRADMQVKLINDGPTTIWIDSKKRE